MKRLTSLVMVAASLVLAASTATAAGATRPDDRANHGAGAVVVVTSEVLRPDDRATHGPGAIGASDTDAVRPDDRAWRGAGPAPAMVPADSSTGVDGFDWVDAGIGAAGALGLGLLLVGGTAFVLRQRKVTAYS
jgi:hypothetical protein